MLHKCPQRQYNIISDIKRGPGWGGGGGGGGWEERILPETVLVSMMVLISLYLIMYTLGINPGYSPCCPHNFLARQPNNLGGRGGGGGGGGNTAIIRHSHTFRLVFGLCHSRYSSVTVRFGQYIVTVPLQN